MVVWVAVRLARLATVAKNLHSQRRFSAMQARSTLTLTSAPPPKAHTPRAQTLDVDFAAEGSEDEGGSPVRP